MIVKGFGAFIHLIMLIFYNYDIKKKKIFISFILFYETN